MPNAFRAVFPAPQKLLDPSSPAHRPGLAEFAPGGRYLMMPGAVDVTEQTVERAVVDVTSGIATFRVAGRAQPDPTLGRVYRLNLFRASAGWKWVNKPKTAEEIDTLVSVEGGGLHFYALRVEIEAPLRLARYADKPSEPRLRPTVHGVPLLGPVAGVIEVRKRQHEVYGLILIEPQ